MTHEPFLSRTGQLWKVAALGLWCAAVLGYLISIVVGRSNGHAVDLLEESAAVAVGILGAVYLTLSIVCPKCRGWTLVHAAKAFSINDLTEELVKMEACPMCG